jgi:hypothetical protein
MASGFLLTEQSFDSDFGSMIQFPGAASSDSSNRVKGDASPAPLALKVGRGFEIFGWLGG